MPRRRNLDHDFFDDEVDPLKGPNWPTEFLKSNFKLMGVGCIFRTVKAKFPPKTIHAEAKKANRIVQIDEEGPWLKVTITGKLKPQPPKIKKQDLYFGAGKKYPPIDIFS